MGRNLSDAVVRSGCKRDQDVSAEFPFRGAVGAPPAKVQRPGTIGLALG